MTIQQAIKKAIDGGWQPKDWDFKTIIFDGLSNNKKVVMFSNGTGEDSLWREYCIEFILLDPFFWQCLGKAMGWGIEPSCSIWQGKEQWIIYWHDFIDHLASGQSVESYFEKL